MKLYFSVLFILLVVLNCMHSHVLSNWSIRKIFADTSQLTEGTNILKGTSDKISVTSPSAIVINGRIKNKLVNEAKNRENKDYDDDNYNYGEYDDINDENFDKIKKDRVVKILQRLILKNHRNYLSAEVVPTGDSDDNFKIVLKPSKRRKNKLRKKIHSNKSNGNRHLKHLNKYNDNSYVETDVKEDDLCDLCKKAMHEKNNTIKYKKESTEVKIVKVQQENLSSTPTLNTLEQDESEITFPSTTKIEKVKYNDFFSSRRNHHSFAMIEPQKKLLSVNTVTENIFHTNKPSTSTSVNNINSSLFLNGSIKSIIILTINFTDNGRSAIDTISNKNESFISENTNKDSVEITCSPFFLSYNNLTSRADAVTSKSKKKVKPKKSNKNYLCLLKENPVIKIENEIKKKQYDDEYDDRIINDEGDDDYDNDDDDNDDSSDDINDEYESNSYRSATINKKNTCDKNGKSNINNCELYEAEQKVINKTKQIKAATKNKNTFKRAKRKLGKFNSKIK